MSLVRRALAGSAAFVFLVALAPLDAHQPAAGRFGSWGVDLSGRDASVAPGDSFFDHANGAWLAKAVIPSDQMTSGVMSDLTNLTAAQVRTMMEESQARAADTGNIGRIGRLYSSYMDEARLETLDAAPLRRDLDALNRMTTRAQMAAFMGRSFGAFGTSIYQLGFLPDLKGAKVYTAALGTGGRGLPERDFYLEDKFKPQRDAYRAHIERTLRLIDWPEPAAAADRIMAFETASAEASWSAVERRDPNKMYKPMAVAELTAFAPSFPWAEWLGGAGLESAGRIIVGEDSAIPKVARLFAETPMETLKAWQAFHMTAQASPYLSRRFVDNQFAFDRVLTGQQQLRPRWYRGVGLTHALIGEAVGEQYVARHFPAESKRAMEALVGNLQRAMRARLERADWMSPATRAEALRKLDTQIVKVGYPSKWRDYSPVSLKADDLYGNVLRASRYAHQFELDRLGKPQDREEWGMTPQTVNAYFNPLANEIVFPAAMLQAPMFSLSADPAVNYGAIGGVIGHEITHSFDDTGRMFDHKGELRDWWTPEDAARFEREAERLAAQYDSYEELPGAKVNGRLTLGENIGDQGGLLIAYDAYKASLGGRPAPVIDGLTGDQRFFLSWAQGWRKKVKDDLTRTLLVTDPHSPARWRVDGTLRNLDPWYAAFDVRPGQKLYLAPDARVRVW